MDRSQLNELILYINQKIRQSFVLFVHGDGGMLTIQDAVRSTLSSQKPTVIYPSASLAAGSGAEAAHYDHQHTFYSDAPASDIGDANSAGSSLWYVSKADHTHRIPRTIGGVAANANDVLVWDGTKWKPNAGALTLASLTIDGLTPSTLIYSNASKQVTSLANSGSVSFLRNDGAGALSWVTTVPPSAHNLLSTSHSDTLTGSVVDGDILIGNATPLWSRLAIAVPAANVRNVLGIDNGELRPSWKTALDATVPTTIIAGAVASPGTSLIFSHCDHTHGAPYPAMVDTKSNILASTATTGKITFASDTQEFYVADGSVWRAHALPLGGVSVGPDIGALAFKEDWGYGQKDIASKNLHSVVIKDFTEGITQLERGAFRCNYTSNSLQYYDGTQWLTVITLTNAQVRDWMLRSQWNSESVVSVPSIGTVTKTNMTLGFVDIGAIPSDLFLDGGELT